MNNQPNVYQKRRKLAIYELLTEIPDFLAVTASAFLTNSLISWMDFIGSICDISNCTFVALLSGKLTRNLKYEYNYGIGKIEAIASLCCDFFMIAGLGCISFFSIIDIITPKQPNELVIYAAIWKVVIIVIDVYFLTSNYKIRNSSRISKSEYVDSLLDFSVDIVALISFIVCYFFRDVYIVWYIAPVFCLIMSAVFLVDCVIRIRGSVVELTDKTLPEEKQLIILKALSSRYNDYTELVSVNSRQSGDRVFIDVNVIFRDDMTYAEILSFLDAVSEKIEAEIEGSSVSVLINGRNKISDAEH